MWRMRTVTMLTAVTLLIALGEHHLADDSESAASGIASGERIATIPYGAVKVVYASVEA